MYGSQLLRQVVRYFPLLIVALVVFAILLSMVLLFVPSLLPSHLQQVGDRIGLVQVFVEFASLAALLLAAWEFRQAQKKPNLQLWMDPLQQGKPMGKPIKDNSAAHEYNSQEGVGTVYAFPFNLLIDNIGSAAARWIKVTLELESNDFAVKDLVVKRTTFRRLSRDHGFGKWIPDSRDAEATKHVFQGGNDYIVYSRPSKISSPQEWMDQLGTFELHVPLKHSYNTQQFKLSIHCYIEADGFPRKKQSLVLRLSNIHQPA